MSLSYFDVREIIRRQQDKGGFEISLLCDGTGLCVETKHSFYNVTLTSGKEMTISGGRLPGGGTRFPWPVPGYLVGCTWGGTMIATNWIGHGMCLEFSAGGKVYTTSRIRNVVIRPAVGNWCYSLDWKSDGSKP